MDDADRLELYDLRADPGESVNLLHGGGAHPEAARMAQALQVPSVIGP